MLFKLRKDAARWWFDRSARAVLDTPPMQCRADATLTVVTQIYPPDLMMYLVAIKTFARFVSIRSVVVVGDRLRGTDQAIIEKHIRPVELLNMEDIDTHGLPRGGCWERLLTVVSRSSSAYTMQLDADTITQTAPHEVLECAAANRSFTLGTAMGRSVVTVQEASAAVRHLASETAHIQIAAEIALQHVTPQPAYYVRGNAAFTGFARGEHSLHSLRNFSEQMSRLLGADKWKQWGSEQVASNYMIANSDNPCVLPFERYRYFQPGASLNSSPFIHFMGTYRFAGGVYRRLARSSIKSMCVSP